MNVNGKILKLKDITGYPVAHGIYNGSSDKWIVFQYTDERGELYGDDEELYTTAKLYISFYCPETFNFMPDKKKIKNALVAEGFQVETIASFLDDTLEGAERVWRVLFEVNYTGLND